MTHTFTPPKTFPHECKTRFGGKTVILIGKSIAYHGAYVGEKEPYEGGKSQAYRYYAHDLRDMPKVTSTWQNVDINICGGKHESRKHADQVASSNRIAVLRRDTIDGVTTCELEPI